MQRFIQWLVGSTGSAPAGARDWRIGFIADHNNYVVLALVAVAVGLVYLTIHSYRREGDAPARAKATLAGIRIGVIALMLLVLFQPAVVFRFVNTLYTSVAVLVDDSLSMSFADRYAGGADLDRLSRATGLRPEAIPGRSRTQILRRMMSGPEGILAKLAQDHPLLLMRFSTDSPSSEAYTQLLGVVDVVDRQEQGVSAGETDVNEDLARMMGCLSGAGYETNIPAALRAAVERLQGRRVAGVVLVSDGQITTADERDRLAGALGYAAQSGVPLYSVMVGDPTLPKNLIVTGLDGPEQVRRGGQAEFTVSLAHRNLGGQDVTVRLLVRGPGQGEWTDTGLARTVRLTGRDDVQSRSVQSIRFDIEPDELGELAYRAVVDPIPDEANPDDNAAEARLLVSDEKISVLLISAEADWEFRYLKNLLLRQDDLYRVSVWQQNADPEINQAASTGMKLRALPRTLEQIIGTGGDPSVDDDGQTRHVGYDVIILHDPMATEDGFDETFVNLLKTFVARHGGGLCYIAGTKYSESVLRGHEDYRALADLLPVTLAPNTVETLERIRKAQPEPWPVGLTSYGLDHPVTRLGGSADDTAGVWRILPGSFWSHPVARTKPAARVLAVSSNPTRRTQRNQPEPLIAVQGVGRGQVLYVGFKDTWRWRFVEEGAYRQRLWGNIIRYLATLQPRQVVITAGGERFSAGERITLDVEAYDEKFQPLTDETFEVQRIDTATGETDALVLEKLAGKPGRYRKTIVADKTGTFELTAMKDDPLADQKVASKRIVVALPQAELRRREADAEVMSNVASRPENFLRIDEAGRLAELIPPGRLTADRYESRELWDSNLTLILIVVLLGVEWILRKKYNMA